MEDSKEEGGGLVFLEEGGAGPLYILCIYLRVCLEPGVGLIVLRGQRQHQCTISAPVLILTAGGVCQCPGGHTDRTQGMTLYVFKVKASPFVNSSPLPPPHHRDQRGLASRSCSPGSGSLAAV